MLNDIMFVLMVLAIATAPLWVTIHMQPAF